MNKNLKPEKEIIYQIPFPKYHSAFYLQSVNQQHIKFRSASCFWSKGNRASFRLFCQSPLFRRQYGQGYLFNGIAYLGQLRDRPGKYGSTCCF